MKTIIQLLIITTLIFSGTSGAQSFSMGPAGAMGIKSQKLFEKIYPWIGYQVGITGRIKFSKSISMAPGLFYANKGYTKYYSEFSIFGNDIEQKSRLELHYVDLHVPVQFYITNSFYFSAGVQLGYLADKEFRYYENNGFYNSTELPVNIRPFDVGILAGFGTQFKNGLGINCMLNHGLIDINQKNPDQELLPPSNQAQFGKNFLATFGLYYLFSLDAKKVTSNK